MTTLLPNFDDASFDLGQPIDNQYFPLTPGTVFSYQGKLYDTEEIVEEVTEEIGEEISDELVEEQLDDEDDEEGEDNEISDELDEDEDSDLDELADDIEDEVDELVDDAVDDIVSELGDDVEAFDSEELAAEISEELTEDVTEELTGEEIELDEAPDDFGDEIVETLDEDLDGIAVQIADEIEEAQANLFATESNQVYVTYDTKNILEVDATVVRDVEWDEGTLVEDTFDWYAQDTDGNVWYLGELSTSYEYDDDGNFIGTNTEGSWEAGVDDALAGYLITANPQVSDRYYQEFAPGIAEDEAEVVSLDETVAVDFGEFDDVLQTREFTQLEPEVFEFNYYAPGVGQILTEEGITEEGGESEISPELVDISEIPNITLPTLSTANFDNSTAIDNPYFTLTPGTLSIYEGQGIDSDTGETEIDTYEVLVTGETKSILGIESLVVQEREYVDEILTEDNLSYYAQDAAGNVWLLGEDEIEYEYDEQGNVVETDDSDSWLAGKGQALPGLIMDGTPEVGEGYYQRFDIGEAEEQAEIANLDAAIDNFGEYDNILQVKEFSTLESDSFDFEYYAPGVGQIYTQELDANGNVIFETSLISVENVDPLNFSLQDSVELV